MYVSPNLKNALHMASQGQAHSVRHGRHNQTYQTLCCSSEKGKQSPAGRERRQPRSRRIAATSSRGGEGGRTAEPRARSEEEAALLLDHHIDDVAVLHLKLRRDGWVWRRLGVSTDDAAAYSRRQPAHDGAAGRWQLTPVAARRLGRAERATRPVQDLHPIQDPRVGSAAHGEHAPARASASH